MRAQLLAIGPYARHRARPERYRTGRVRRNRRHAAYNQRREGEEAAAPRHRVERAAHQRRQYQQSSLDWPHASRLCSLPGNLRDFISSTIPAWKNKLASMLQSVQVCPWSPVAASVVEAGSAWRSSVGTDTKVSAWRSQLAVATISLPASALPAG